MVVMLVWGVHVIVDGGVGVVGGVCYCLGDGLLYVLFVFYDCLWYGVVQIVLCFVFVFL